MTYLPSNLSTQRPIYLATYLPSTYLPSNLSTQRPIYQATYLPHLPHFTYLPQFPHLPHLPHFTYLPQLPHLPHLPWGRWATSDLKTSDVETGDSRTSNSRISLFKGVDTIKWTLKNWSLRGLGTSYVRGLGISHVLHCSPFTSISSSTVVTVVTQYQPWNFKSHK